MTLDIAVTTDLKTCLHLRHVVFVEEQGVPVAEEQDAADATATHLMARVQGTPVGTARIVPKGDTAKIGRVCVLRQARGTGAGQALMRTALATARQMPGLHRAVLGAQLEARGFYERLGFEAFGPVYDDAGIDHQDMSLTL